VWKEFNTYFTICFLSELDERLKEKCRYFNLPTFHLSKQILTTESMNKSRLPSVNYYLRTSGLGETRTRYPAAKVGSRSHTVPGAKTTYRRRKHKMKRRNALGRESQDETTGPCVDSENESNELEKFQCE